jgi:hypothetical protein
MAAIVNTVCNNILDSLGPAGAAAAPTITGPLKCRLMTANGSGSSAGTELSTGGSYTAAGSGMGTVTWNAAAANAKTNSVAVTQLNMPASSLTGVELWDSAGTPIRVWYGGLTGQPIAVAAGNTFTLPVTTGLSLGLT